MKSLLTLVFGLVVVDAANRCIELDPDYKPQAIDLCERFYKTRNASESSTSVKCVGNGAESIVYRCQTAENMDPPQVALKIYFHSGSKNFTELSLIDMQLYEQGIRYPVYEWFDDIGKAELFFEGLKDEPDFSMPAVRTQMAKVLAKLHSGHVNGINKVKYRSTKSDGWWNTYEVENHFEQIWWLMKHASDKFPGSPELIYETVKMNKRDFWTEVKLVEKILQSYYTANPETAVICHNDPHMKNIMVNKEGDFDPASLMLIDYDQAGYGFRAFDLLYNIFNWNYLPNDDDELTFINDYVAEFNIINNSTDLTSTLMQAEFRAHKPYMLLARKAFLLSFGLSPTDQHIVNLREKYIDLMATEYNHTVPESDALRLWAISSLVLLILSLAI